MRRDELSAWLQTAARALILVALAVVTAVLWLPL